MNKLPILIAVLMAVVSAFSSCKDNDDDWDAYAEWRETNDKWLKEQQARKNPDGTPYFQTIVPEWNPAAFVLIHYFNDRKLTEGNYSPMLTSTVDTRYKLYYCTGTAIDSSDNVSTYGPGIFRTQLNKVITGWTIAMEQMRVGDTAEVIIPYQQAYGVATTGGVLPYSNLRFNMRLVDIYAYEVNPK